jgi:hypothetical protein
MELESDITKETVASSLAGAAGVHLGAVEFAQFNVVTEFGLPPELVFGGAAVAGGAVLVEKWTDENLLRD